MARTVVYDGDMLNPVIDGSLALDIEQAILDAGIPLIAPRAGAAIVGESRLVSSEHTIIIDGDMKPLELSADLNLDAQLDGEYGIVTKVNGGAYPEYTGATRIAPSTQQQTLATAQRTLMQDIIIEPIPSNYGLIEWNGSTLTVR